MGHQQLCVREGGGLQESWVRKGGWCFNCDNYIRKISQLQRSYIVYSLVGVCRIMSICCYVLFIPKPAIYIVKENKWFLMKWNEAKVTFDSPNIFDCFQ